MSSISPDENALAPIAPLAPVAPLAPAAPELTFPPVAPAPVVADEPDSSLNVPLGTLIFRAGLVAEHQLEDALQEGLKTGKRLGEVLLERELVSERDLGRLLAGQKGLQFVELATFPVQPEAAAMMSEEKARLYGALPIGLEDGIPLVAVADPSNELVVENVRRALGRTPDFVVVARDDLLRATERTYGVETAAAEVVAAPQASPPFLVQPEAEVQPAPPVAPLVAPLAPPVEQPPVAQVQEPLLVQPAAAAPDPSEAIPATEEPVMPPVPPVEHMLAPVLPAPEPPAQAPVESWLPPAAPVPVESFLPPAAAAPVPPVESFLPPAAPVPPVESFVPAAVPVPPVPPVESFVPPAAPVESPVAPLPVAPEVPLVLPPPPPAPALAAPAPLVPHYEEPVAQPASEPVETPPTPEHVPAPTPEPADAVHVVVLRMSDGERIGVGCFGDAPQATEYARDVVNHLGAHSDGSWPLFEGRFLRPDTIVSVDVVAEQTEQWLGSRLRTRWAANLS